MNDTDKLIAAIFAASMTARRTEPDVAAFFSYYESCIAGLIDRESAAAEAKAERTAQAHKAAWG